jgi:hypothetical protein
MEAVERRKIVAISGLSRLSSLQYDSPLIHNVDNVEHDVSYRLLQLNA